MTPRRTRAVSAEILERIATQGINVDAQYVLEALYAISQNAAGDVTHVTAQVMIEEILTKWWEAGTE